MTRDDCNPTQPTRLFPPSSYVGGRGRPDVGEARGVNCHPQKDLMGKDVAEVV